MLWLSKRNLSLSLREKQAEIKGNFRCVLESYSFNEALDTQLCEDQDAINDIYAQISNAIDTLTPASESSSSGNSVASCSHNTAVAHVRIPKLALKRFSGEPLSWVSFINLFDTRIYNNVSLSNMAQMQYLLSVFLRYLSIWSGHLISPLLTIK